MVGRTVALRTNGCVDVFFVDVDVQDEDARDKIIAAYAARWPDFMRDCVVRRSGGIKIMLIGRLITGKKSMHSSRWGVSKEFPQGHRVELFTSNDNRYVAVWGMHSEGVDYGYDGPVLYTVPRETLPWFLDADLHELLDIADRILAECGMSRDEDGAGGDDETVYDLEPQMLWKRQDGSFVRLDDLERELDGAADWARGWPNLWDPKAASRSGGRVKAKVTPGQGLFGCGWRDQVKHRWKHLGAQPDVLAPLLKKLAADVTAMGEKVVFGQPAPERPAGEDPPARPSHDATLKQKMGWLLETQAYCRFTDTVVDIFQAGHGVSIDTERDTDGIRSVVGAGHRRQRTRTEITHIGVHDVDGIAGTIGCCRCAHASRAAVSTVCGITRPGRTLPTSTPRW